MNAENPMFTADGLDLLFEAVETWQSEPSRDGLMSGILRSMAGKVTGEEMDADIERNFAEARQKADREILTRKRRGIFLQAKLMEMKSRASEFSTSITPPPLAAKPGAA